MPEVPRQAASWLGMNTRDMWNSFLPGLPMELKQKAALLVGEAMAEQVRAHRAAWYPGVRDVLDTLKSRSFHMSILSNCQRSYGLIHWEEFGMDRWFDAFYDCETYGHAPKSGIILEIGRTLPPPYVVIGDRGQRSGLRQSLRQPLHRLPVRLRLPGGTLRRRLPDPEAGRASPGAGTLDRLVPAQRSASKAAAGPSAANPVADRRPAAASISYSIQLRCQISSLYWAMVRSEEKYPALAILTRAFRFQLFRSA